MMPSLATAFCAVIGPRELVHKTQQVSDPHGFRADIPLSLAILAHSGTSFSPEKRGHSERDGYAATLTNLYSELKAHARTPEMLATLDVEFARLRDGYAKRYRAYLASKSRTMSAMITGPSNFPLRQMEKRNGVVDSRLRELVEFIPRAKSAILKALHPELRPIMSGDANATERLAEKIATAELVQERMKAANLAIRKHAKAGKDAQVSALVVIGFTEAQATKILHPDFCGRIGFPGWELTNNNANITRMKSRLAEVSRNQTREAVVVEGANGVRMEDCPADNRVRLFFAGKPDASVRSDLKSHGFRWSPTIGAWQAYRNDRAMNKAREVAA